MRKLHRLIDFMCNKPCNGRSGHIKVKGNVMVYGRTPIATRCNGVVKILNVANRNSAICKVQEDMVLLSNKIK